MLSLAQMVKNLPVTRDSQIRSLSREDPLEEKTATHSNILAWRIPWTEQPARLQSMETRKSDMTEWLSTHACDWLTLLRVLYTYSQNIYSVPTSFSALSQEPRTQLWGGQKRGLFSGKKKTLFFSYHCKIIQALSKDSKTNGWKLVKELNIHMFSKYRY